MPDDQDGQEDMATSDPTKKSRTTRRDSTASSKEDQSVRELLVQMNKRFDTLATKEDLTDIRSQIKQNSDEIAGVRDEMRASAADIRSEMKANTESLPEAVQSEIYKVLRNKANGGAHSEELRQHQNYLRCRRSVRMWPVLDLSLIHI